MLNRQFWSESTDPSKYVYEDIAISAYLIVLWEHEQVSTGCPKQVCDYFCVTGAEFRRLLIWDVAMVFLSFCLTQRAIKVGFAVSCGWHLVVMSSILVIVLLLLLLLLLLLILKALVLICANGRSGISLQLCQR